MKILSVDFGETRTGYAVSDELMFGATTLENFKSHSIDAVAMHTIALAKEHNAQRIVVGFPKNMNGTVGERGEKTLRLKEKIEKLSDYPVVLWDERLTTVSAHNLMNTTNVRGKKRKESVDSISAAFILQSYLDSLK